MKELPLLSRRSRLLQAIYIAERVGALLFSALMLAMFAVLFHLAAREVYGVDFVKQTREWWQNRSKRDEESEALRKMWDPG